MINRTAWAVAAATAFAAYATQALAGGLVLLPVSVTGEADVLYGGGNSAQYAGLPAIPPGGAGVSNDPADPYDPYFSYASAAAFSSSFPAVSVVARGAAWAEVELDFTLAVVGADNTTVPIDVGGFFSVVGVPADLTAYATLTDLQTFGLSIDRTTIPNLDTTPACSPTGCSDRASGNFNMMVDVPTNQLIFVRLVAAARPYRTCQGVDNPAPFTCADAGDGFYNFGNTAASVGTGFRIDPGFAQGGDYTLQLSDGLDNSPNPLMWQSTAVPEPATWALLIAGMAMTGAAIRRRRRAQVAA